MLILEAGPIVIYTLSLSHLGSTATVLLILIFQYANFFGVYDVIASDPTVV